MIFLFIILFVVLVVAVFNYIDGNNIKKIEDFLNQQSCKEINYTNGQYQAICLDKVIVVQNAFSVDLADAKTVYYKTLKDIKVEEKSLVLQTNEEITLKFKDENSRKNFLNKLEEKRIQWMK